MAPLGRSLHSAESENREVGRLEDAAELEKPFLVASVANAAADEDGTEKGLGQDATGRVTGKSRGGEGVAVHFADFGEARDIDLLADELREGKDFVQVPGAANEILVADEFVEAVGAQASDTESSSNPTRNQCG